MDATELAIVLIFVLPPAGAAAAAALGRRLGQASPWLAALPCVAAGAVAAVHGTAERVLTAGRWFHLESLPEVSLRLRLDPLAAVILVPTLLAAATILAAHRSGPDSLRQPSLDRRMAVLLFASIGLVLSTNLVFILLFWQLIPLAGSSLLNPSACRAASGRVLVIHRAPDVLFVTAILLAWHHFGSLDLETIRARLPAPAGGPFPAVRGTIALGVFVAAAARCAQFPFFLWLDDVVDAVPGTMAAVLGVLVAPTAFYLIARTNALLTVSTEARLAIAGIAAATVLLAPTVALVETRWRAVVAYCGAALFGWMFVGLATGSAAGLTGAVMLLAAHCFATTTLLAAASDESTPPGTSFPGLWFGSHIVIAAAILTVGLWGQNLILAATWPITDAAAAIRLPAAPVLLMLLFPGQALLALALFRAVFLARRASLGTSTKNRGILTAALLIPAAVAILILPFTAESWWARLLSAMAAGSTLLDPDPLALLPGLFTSLLGMVAAWTIYSRPSAWAEPLARAVGPLGRMARQRLYLERMFSFALVLPVLGLAHAARFVDRLLVEGLVVGISARVPGILARAALPLEGRPVQFAALSILLAAGVLLLVILSSSGH